MPRKPLTQSKFIVTTIHDSSDDSIMPQDALLHDKLKILGRGNRANVAGIAELLGALQLSRNGSTRIKSTYLSANDLKHIEVVKALEGLGVLSKVLTESELSGIKAGRPLTPDTLAQLNKATEHFMEMAAKYL
jgi:hypothetical protein